MSPIGHLRTFYPANPDVHIDAPSVESKQTLLSHPLGIDTIPGPQNATDLRYVAQKQKVYVVKLPLMCKPSVVKELVHEEQFARCMSNRYKSDAFPRCVSCTRRWAGDTCRFQGIRFFSRDPQKFLMAYSFLPHTVNCPDKALDSLPSGWNVPLERMHVDRTMVSLT